MITHHVKNLKSIIVYHQWDYITHKNELFTEFINNKARE